MPVGQIRLECFSRSSLAGGRPKYGEASLSGGNDFYGSPAPAKELFVGAEHTDGGGDECKLGFGKLAPDCSLQITLRLIFY